MSYAHSLAPAAAQASSQPHARDSGSVAASASSRGFSLSMQQRLAAVATRALAGEVAQTGPDMEVDGLSRLLEKFTALSVRQGATVAEESHSCKASRAARPVCCVASDEQDQDTVWPLQQEGVEKRFVLPEVGADAAVRGSARAALSNLQPAASAARVDQARDDGVDDMRFQAIGQPFQRKRRARTRRVVLPDAEAEAARELTRGFRKRVGDTATLPPAALAATSGALSLLPGSKTHKTHSSDNARFSRN